MATNAKQYDFHTIEVYWQNYWDSKQIFKALDNSVKEKFYALDMLPYPSGQGLHVGHPEGYTASDILARYKRACGYNVLHPMGWDAFGLPAEQHAILTGTHPAENTKKNISNFKKQLKKLGFAYDWGREVDTTDPATYKWTQWLFLQIFKKGLAYVDEFPVWWCPALGTGLANEEVIDGRSERGNHPVERRNLRQWMMKITAYAERLLEGLKDLDWPESTKKQQETWIGKSEGAEVFFHIEGFAEEKLVTYTTRADTLFGATYLVIAPEHPLVEKLTQTPYKNELEAYVKTALTKSDLLRTELAKEKTGVFTGSYAIHPITEERLPIWVADYVMLSYGTGAVMGVPGHDKRDYEFAEKFKLPIRAVISDNPTNLNPPALLREGYLIHSGAFDKLHCLEAKQKITEYLENNQQGRPKVHYKLRDWLFSRQRYWGEPFPVVWINQTDFDQLKKLKNSCIHASMPSEPVTYKKEEELFYAIPLPLSELPLLLPDVQSYQPSGTGESPLANISEWVNVYINLETGETSSIADPMPKEGIWVKGKRETNTMPQWAGSCWYYLRYLDPHNEVTFLDQQKEQYWKTPDIYIGGAEHAVLHLLYARFWHQVFFDLGLVSTQEPFPKIFHQGLILGETEYCVFEDKEGNAISAEHVDAKEKIDLRSKASVFSKVVSERDIIKKEDQFVLKENPSIKVEARSFKMSKSRGNVVGVDEIVNHYGADALRMYEMFLGPLEAMKPWSTKNIEGISRFLRKVWREYIDDNNGQVNPKILEQCQESEVTTKLLHETIQKVSEDIEALRLNTAISQMMIFVSHLQKLSFIKKETAKIFLQLLAPFAPHICEELWERLGEKPSIVEVPWPQYEKDKLIQDQVKVMVQVNGKLRSELVVSKNEPKELVLNLARKNEKIMPYLEGKRIVKEIYVPGKIINFVVN